MKPHQTDYYAKVLLGSLKKKKSAARRHKISVGLTELSKVLTEMRTASGDETLSVSMFSRDRILLVSKTSIGRYGLRNFLDVLKLER